MKVLCSVLSGGVGGTREKGTDTRQSDRHIGKDRDRNSEKQTDGDMTVVG